MWFGVARVAAAENLCTAHANIAKRLESGYAETPVAIGLSANGGSVEVFAGAAWDGRDTAPARAPRRERSGLAERIRAGRAGSEGPAPEPGRIQPGQFPVFTL